MRLDYSAQSERIRKSTFLYALIFILVFFTVLGLRLWYLQVIRGDHYRRLSENNRIKSYRLPAPRGRILDRSGDTLADYAPSYDVYYVEEYLPENPNAAIQVKKQAARICGIRIQDLDKKLEKARRGRPVRILIDASRDILTAIEEKRMAYEGRFPLEIDTVSKRVYLHVGMLAHFLGYCGEITEQMLGQSEYDNYRPGDMVGKNGVEQAFEHMLHGKPGREWYEENARRTRLRLLNREPAIPGHSLVLSIDSKLQLAAMRAFNQAAGAVVAMDPKTGFILAAHSAPTFDAEMFSRTTPAGIWKEIVNDPLKPMQNRVIAGAYPPGSTFKLFMAAAGLQEGVITPHTSIYCPGQYKLGNYTFRCWNRAGHGNTDLIGSIRESCDVYYYNLGQRLGIDTISEYVSAFGYGKPTGLGILGERGGIAPTRAWKKKRFGQSWMSGDTVSVSIGQGYNLATPLQVCASFCALVNGGTLYRPQVVASIRDALGSVSQKFEPEAVRQVPVDQAHLELLKKAMVEVVHKPHGTARPARIPGIISGGKTGTAQVVIQRGPKTLTLEETEYARRDHAWYVGYAPAEDPQIVVAVIAEHSGHGGSAASPIARKVIEAYLKTGTGDEGEEQADAQ